MYLFCFVFQINRISDTQTKNKINWVSNLHIRHVVLKFVFQHPKQWSHSFDSLFGHFLSDVYALLKRRRNITINMVRYTCHSIGVVTDKSDLLLLEKQPSICTFGSISARTSFKIWRSCIGSRESNITRLKFFLNGSLLSCSTINFSFSLIMMLAISSFPPVGLLVAKLAS